MNPTLFTTPLVQPWLKAAARAFLRLRGWRVEGRLPQTAERCVFIAAPHTSNWDLPYTLMLALCLDLQVHWLGKSGLFRWPFGGVMRWLGGLPVDRSGGRNQVAAAAMLLQQARGPLQLIVPPEGTRGRTRHWRTGFYFIALQAQVPIVLAYIDFGRKVGGLGPVFTPSGDVDADMVRIKAFYAPVQGRNPTQFDAV